MSDASDILAALTLDFLAWLAPGPRPYAEVMEAWRTSCPRLTIWEDAVDARLVTFLHPSGQPVHVGLTERGIATIASHRNCTANG